MAKWPSIIRDLVTETEKEVDKAYEADDTLSEDDELLITTLLSAVKATLHDGFEAGLDELDPVASFLQEGGEDDSK